MTTSALCESSEQLRYSLQYTLNGHQRSVSSLKFSPCGTLLASSSADKSVRVWEVETGKQRHLMNSHKQVGRDGLG